MPLRNVSNLEQSVESPENTGPAIEPVSEQARVPPIDVQTVPRQGQPTLIDRPVISVEDQQNLDLELPLIDLTDGQKYSDLTHKSYHGFGEPDAYALSSDQMERVEKYAVQINLHATEKALTWQENTDDGYKLEMIDAAPLAFRAELERQLQHTTPTNLATPEPFLGDNPALQNTSVAGVRAEAIESAQDAGARSTSEVNEAPFLDDNPALQNTSVAGDRAEVIELAQDAGARSTSEVNEATRNNASSEEDAPRETREEKTARWVRENPEDVEKEVSSVVDKLLRWSQDASSIKEIAELVGEFSYDWPEKQRNEIYGRALAAYPELDPERTYTADGSVAPPNFRGQDEALSTNEPVSGDTTLDERSRADSRGI